MSRQVNFYVLPDEFASWLWDALGATESRAFRNPSSGSLVEIGGARWSWPNVSDEVGLWVIPARLADHIKVHQGGKGNLYVNTDEPGLEVSLCYMNDRVLPRRRVYDQWTRKAELARWGREYSLWTDRWLSLAAGIAPRDRDSSFRVSDGARILLAKHGLTPD